MILKKILSKKKVSSFFKNFNMVPTKNLFENDMYITKVGSLLEQLSLKPNNLNHYLLAFVHRSLVNEKPDLSAEHNERLEFLGDAVLELVITTELFLNFPKKPEGELTDYRSSIVKGTHLASVARKLGFQEYLILGKGEELGGGRNNDYLLANCTEAFLGALYLDLGYEVSKAFILENIYADLEAILLSQPVKDYKSLLQEYTQSVFSITPEYRVLGEFGLDHEKSYTSGVYLRETLIGEGSGSSKKKSQEDAAKNAYMQKENISLNR